MKYLTVHSVRAQNIEPKAKPATERKYCPGTGKKIASEKGHRNMYGSWGQNARKYPCPNCDKYIGKDSKGAYNKHGWNDVPLTPEEVAAKVAAKQEKDRLAEIAKKEALVKKLKKQGKYTPCANCSEPIFFDVDYLCAACREAL